MPRQLPHPGQALSEAIKQTWRELCHTKHRRLASIPEMAARRREPSELQTIGSEDLRLFLERHDSLAAPKLTHEEAVQLTMVIAPLNNQGLVAWEEFSRFFALPDDEDEEDSDLHGVHGDRLFCHGPDAVDPSVLSCGASSSTMSHSLRSCAALLDDLDCQDQLAPLFEAFLDWRITAKRAQPANPAAEAPPTVAKPQSPLGQYMAAGRRYRNLRADFIQSILRRAHRTASDDVDQPGTSTPAPPPPVGSLSPILGLCHLAWVPWGLARGQGGQEGSSDFFDEEEDWEDTASEEEQDWAEQWSGSDSDASNSEEIKGIGQSPSFCSDPERRRSWRGRTAAQYASKATVARRGARAQVLRGREREPARRRRQQCPCDPSEIALLVLHTQASAPLRNRVNYGGSKKGVTAAAKPTQGPVEGHGVDLVAFLDGLCRLKHGDMVHVFVDDSISSKERLQETQAVEAAAGPVLTGPAAKTSAFGPRDVAAVFSVGDKDAEGFLLKVARHAALHASRSRAAAYATDTCLALLRAFHQASSKNKADECSRDFLSIPQFGKALSLVLGNFRITMEEVEDSSGPFRVLACRGSRFSVYRPEHHDRLEFAVARQGRPLLDCHAFVALVRRAMLVTWARQPDMREGTDWHMAQRLVAELQRRFADLRAVAEGGARSSNSGGQSHAFARLAARTYRRACQPGSNRIAPGAFLECVAALDELLLPQHLDTVEASGSVPAGTHHVSFNLDAREPFVDPLPFNEARRCRYLRMVVTEFFDDHGDGCADYRELHAFFLNGVLGQELCSDLRRELRWHRPRGKTGRQRGHRCTPGPGVPSGALVRLDSSSSSDDASADSPPSSPCLGARRGPVPCAYDHRSPFDARRREVKPQGLDTQALRRYLARHGSRKGLVSARRLLRGLDKFTLSAQLQASDVETLLARLDPGSTGTIPLEALTDPLLQSCGVPLHGGGGLDCGVALREQGRRVWHILAQIHDAALEAKKEGWTIRRAFQRFDVRRRGTVTPAIAVDALHTLGCDLSDEDWNLVSELLPPRSDGLVDYVELEKLVLSSTPKPKPPQSPGDGTQDWRELSSLGWKRFCRRLDSEVSKQRARWGGSFDLHRFLRRETASRLSGRVVPTSALVEALSRMGLAVDSEDLEALAQFNHAMHMGHQDPPDEQFLNLDAFLQAVEVTTAGLHANSAEVASRLKWLENAAPLLDPGEQIYRRNGSSLLPARVLRDWGDGHIDLFRDPAGSVERRVPVSQIVRHHATTAGTVGRARLSGAHCMDAQGIIAALAHGLESRPSLMARIAEALSEEDRHGTGKISSRVFKAVLTATMSHHVPISHSDLDKLCQAFAAGGFPSGVPGAAAVDYLSFLSHIQGVAQGPGTIAEPADKLPMLSLAIDSPFSRSRQSPAERGGEKATSFSLAEASNVDTGFAVSPLSKCGSPVRDAAVAMWGANTPIQERGNVPPQARPHFDDEREWMCTTCLYMHNPRGAPTCAGDWEAVAHVHNGPGYRCGQSPAPRPTAPNTHDHSPRKVSLSAC